MLPPDSAKRMQAEIDAALESASKDPNLQLLADEALASAKDAAARMLAARIAGPGYVGALYSALLKKGLLLRK